MENRMIQQTTHQEKKYQKTRQYY